MPTLSIPPFSTLNQLHVMEAIERSQLQKQPAPSYRELAAIVPGISSFSSVSSIVEQLTVKGYLGPKVTYNRSFEVKVPVLAPRYIGRLEADGSLSEGSPKKIPHCRSWERCVGVERTEDNRDRGRLAGDILILRPTQGYWGQSLERLTHWTNQPESLEFAPVAAAFDLVGLWRDLD